MPSALIDHLNELYREKHRELLLAHYEYLGIRPGGGQPGVELDYEVRMAGIEPAIRNNAKKLNNCKISTLEYLHQRLHEEGDGHEVAHFEDGTWACHVIDELPV